MRSTQVHETWVSHITNIESQRVSASA